MPITWFQPSNEEFTGIVNSCQGHCEDDFTIESPSVFNEGTNEPYSPSIAFNWNYTKFPAATLNGEKWISFSHNSKSIFVTHYELMQRLNTDIENKMRDWVFEGSLDGENWKILDHSKSDDSFIHNGTHKLFKCKEGVFTNYRVRELFSERIILQRIEIYGFLCETFDECKLSYLFYKTHSKEHSFIPYLSQMLLVILIL